MYTRYYDGYSSQMPRPVPAPQEAQDECVKTQEIETDSNASDEVIETKSFSPTKAFGNFKSDDLLLIALIFLIATESADDFLMPLILGALLLG